jgi:hypothetical protein
MESRVKLVLKILSCSKLRVTETNNRVCKMSCSEPGHVSKLARICSLTRAMHTTSDTRVSIDEC